MAQLLKAPGALVEDSVQFPAPRIYMVAHTVPNSWSSGANIPWATGNHLVHIHIYTGRTLMHRLKKIKWYNLNTHTHTHTFLFFFWRTLLIQTPKENPGIHWSWDESSSCGPDLLYKPRAESRLLSTELCFKWMCSQGLKETWRDTMRLDVSSLFTKS